MILTSENYYSLEANLEYVSVSQYKDFFGVADRLGCEACALAKLRGEIEQVMTTPLLMGAYVDAFFEGTLSTFKAQHPEIISSRGKSVGELKSDYKQAEVMIERALRDELFMKYMEGDKQVIMTGEISGVPIKIKIDSFDGRRITDLKTVRSITDTYFDTQTRERKNFVEWWGYDLQAAVYQEIVRQNTGEVYPFFICAISKDKTDNVPHPRIRVIEVPPTMMEERLEEFKQNVENIQMLKKGEIEPTRCEHCDYCADTEILTGPVSVDELMEG